MPATPRPQRRSIRDETGQWRSLADGRQAFTTFGPGSEPIVLGLGPDPAVAAACVPPDRDAFYLECPDFIAAMPADWQAAIPARLRPLAPAALTPARVARSRFFLYRQNLRLFPTFWGEIWARIQLALIPAPRSGKMLGTGPVLLAQTRAGLLEPELARALAALGQGVTAIPAETALEAVKTALAEDAPACYCCVNGAGLDDDGLTAALLGAAGVPVSIWFVDNPFHSISRLRAPFWKKAHLFVTDAWFTDRLRELGACSVHHLPLAAGHQFFAATPTPGLAEQAVFVGRSAFPDRDRFFAGCHPPAVLVAQARAMLERGERPDFGWWLDRLDLGPLWPGKAVRLAGCGAETAGLAWRAACLGDLGEAMPLALYGDAGWRELVPGAALHEPVDYYGALPGLYAGAAVTLNLTSLLLPRGLTQRHFDVWAAGGVLVTDATPGLDLFPVELTRAISFTRPDELGRRARELAGNQALRAELAAGWRELVAAEHTYEKRLSRLLEVVLGPHHP